MPVHATLATYPSGPLVGQPTKVQPDGSLQAGGHYPDDAPSPTMFNYREWATSEFLHYLDARELMNVQATPHDYDEAVFGLTNPATVNGTHCVAYSGFRQQLYICGAAPGLSHFLAWTEDLGKTWNERSVPTIEAPNAIAYDQTPIAANDRGYLSTPSRGGYYNGTVWTIELPANLTAAAGVVWCPGAVESFCLYGAVAGGPGIWTSDGDPATQRTVPALAGHTMQEVAWGGPGVGFVGVSDNGASSVVWTSLTGAAWINTGVDAGGPGVKIAYDEKRELFVRVGANGIGVLTSFDGVTWTLTPAGLPGSLVFAPGHLVQRILCRGGTWVIVTRTTNSGSKRCMVWTSVDAGATWEGTVTGLPSLTSAPVSAAFIEGDAQRLVLASGTSLAVGIRSR